jgi:hypothetical protein
MDNYDVDRRVALGLGMGLVAFVVVYGLLVVLFQGWGLALGWIGGLIAAGATLYAFYRSETFTRIVIALFEALSVPMGGL